MKVLILSTSGDLAVALALDAIKNGHKAEVWIKGKDYPMIGQGVVKVMRGTPPDLGQYGFVIVSGRGVTNITDESPVPVLGPNKEAEKLEIDRRHGMTIMQEAGIEVPEWWYFDDVERGAAFARKYGAPLVLKPNGANALSSMTCVGNFEDNADVISSLRLSAKRNPEIGREGFIFQAKVAGIEMSSGAFFNGTDFVLPAMQTYENKQLAPPPWSGQATGELGSHAFWDYDNKLFHETTEKMQAYLANIGYVGDVDINCLLTKQGPRALEFTCYDEQTEILTKQHGWQLFKEVSVGEEVCTLNPETHEIEYQAVCGTVAQPYVGYLLQPRTNKIRGAADGAWSTLDLRVTPNHQMYLMMPKGKRGQHRKWEFLRADTISKRSCQIKRSGVWKGTAEDTYTVPEYVEQHYLGKYRRYHPIPHTAKTIPMKTWVRFLALFLSEGCIHYQQGVPSQVQITQIKIQSAQRMGEWLQGMPWKVFSHERGFTITSVQLAKHLESYGFGKQPTRFVPQIVKNLSPELIEVFLEAFCLGDGTTHKRTGQRSFFSSSKRLLDDIQELLMKTGKLGIIKRTQQVAGSAMAVGDGQTYFRNHDVYVLYERAKSVDTWICGMEKVPYSGKVYCVEVPNHIIYVRRGGQPFFCGQTRLGFPSTCLQMANFASDWTQFLYDVATGKDVSYLTKARWCVGVLLTRPPFPLEDQIKDQSFFTGAPIYGPVFKLPGFYPLDVMLDDEQEPASAGTGYIGVACGLGPTLDVARREAYRVLSKIETSGMYARPDIGERWYGERQELEERGYLP